MADETKPKKACEPSALPEKTLSNIEQFVKDVYRFNQYVEYQTKENFFYDTQSKEIDQITKALCDFILNMPKLITDKSAMGRYRYQSLPDMLDTINPILAKFGLKCTQPPHTIGDTTYIVTKVTHISGQYFRSVTSLPKIYIMGGKPVETSENLQAMGGAQTYVKRHALKGILGIDADDDTDGGK